MDLAALIQRVHAEFVEMPGLRLTLAQATRLWGVEPAVCRQAIDALVGTRFLRWTPTGTVIRRDQWLGTPTREARPIGASSQTVV